MGLNIEIAGRQVTAKWVKLEDIVRDPGLDRPGDIPLAGPVFVVEGPAAGHWWQERNTVAGIRSVTQLADRTVMEVELTNGVEIAGSFSGMRFVTVEMIDC